MSEFDNLHDKLVAGNISRREFMTRVSALGAAAAVPGALYSGRAAAQPKSGGHFRRGAGYGSTTDSLVFDPPPMNAIARPARPPRPPNMRKPPVSRPRE